MKATDKKPVPITKWVDLNATEAKEWLKLNCALNRPLSMAQVSQYAKDMVEGTWHETAPHTPIAFDWDGNLDQGRVRGASDHFAVMFKQERGQDAKNHKWVTSIARAMLQGVSARRQEAAALERAATQTQPVGKES